MIMGGALVFPLHLRSERVPPPPTLSLQKSASSLTALLLFRPGHGGGSGRELRPLLRFIKYLAADRATKAAAYMQRRKYVSRV
jgi:hypothetical protein